MTSVSDINPRTIEVSLPTSSGIGWRFPLRYSSIPAFVCAFDVFLILTTAVLAGNAYSSVQNSDIDLSRYIVTAAIIAAIFVPLLYNRGLYTPVALVNFSSQFRNILGLWTVAFLAFASIAFALKVGSDFSRGAVLLFGIVGLMAILLHHAVWRTIIEPALEIGALRGRRSILLCLHEPPWADDVMQNIARDFVRHGYEIMQFFHFGADIPKKQVIEDVIAFTRGSDLEEIFFAADVQQWSEISDIAQALRVIPLPLTILPDVDTAELFQRRAVQFGSTVGIQFRRAPLSQMEQFLKRLLDIVCSVGATIILLPMFFIVALAIKLDSAGPVFFMQTRYGFNGKRFRILKFRTMTVLEDGESVPQAVRGDSRVTRIGRWLRMTSIDEIPQFFNVLKGDMSIVGPRPHPVALDNHFAELISRYAFRHHVKPGITGWAQIHGFRGETPTVNSMKERVERDIWYIDNWSALLEIYIMLCTGLELIRSRNAY